MAGPATTRNVARAIISSGDPRKTHAVVSDGVTACVLDAYSGHAGVVAASTNQRQLFVLNAEDAASMLGLAAPQAWLAAPTGCAIGGDEWVSAASLLRPC
jgi:hypothetical protein